MLMTRKRKPKSSRKPKTKASPAPRTWVLLDKAKGHQNQALGVAEALGFPYETRQLVYTVYAKIPNWMKFPAFGLDALGVHPTRSDRLAAPWPELVIACGRRTAPVARYIKYKAGEDENGVARCRIAQLMWPGNPLEPFDLIAVPSHDGYTVSGEQFMTILGSPHRVTEAQLTEARTRWLASRHEPPRPVITLLVGGNTKRSAFKTKQADHLIRMVLQLALDGRGSVLVSTSRRTPDAAYKVIRDQLSRSPLECGEVYHWKQKGENPYYAYLALADAIVVTGDSISMMSEACGSGKPVYIYSPEGFAPEKHERFQAELVREGHATMLEESLLGAIRETLLAHGHTPKPLNPAHEVAEKLRGWY